jgi:methylated-DNA-[protein]-cysteine S-methyltransferase
MDDMRKFDGLGVNGADLDDEIVNQLLRVAHTRFDRRLNRIRRPQAHVAVVASPLGDLFVAESARGLLSLKFDSRDSSETIAMLRQRFDVTEEGPLATRIGDEIERLMDGDLDAILRHPVDLSLVESDFQRRALKRLRQIPPGSVVSYQALAALVGSPSSQRAIGNTVASNPVPIYVPCHRVIRSDGSIGNYGGGVERKLKLLRAEGFGVDSARRVPARAVYGHWVSRIFCRPECSAVRRANRKNWIIFADPEQARRSGMRACKRCQPA